MRRKVKIVVDQNRLFDAIEKAVEKKLDYAAAAESYAEGLNKRLREQLGWIGEATADRILGDMLPEKE